MEYRITCSNRSAMHGSFAIYQTPLPSNGRSSVLSVAMMSRATAPATRVSFTWTPTYSFVWGEGGHLNSNVSFCACQELGADPLRENVVDLVQDRYGAPEFRNPRVGGPSGTLTINQINATYDFPVSVGVGVGGRPAYLVPFNANVSTLFIPHPSQYWIVFGGHVAGGVIDHTTLTQAIPVELSPQAPTQSVILGEDNTLYLAKRN